MRVRERRERVYRMERVFGSEPNSVQNPLDKNIVQNEQQRCECGTGTASFDEQTDEMGTHRLPTFNEHN